MDESQEEQKPSYLKRPGMHPVTEEFAELYRRKSERDGRNPTRNTKTNRALTPEELEAVCKALGIENGRQLGEFLGLTARRGQEIMRDPSKLSLLNARKLEIEAINREQDLIHLEEDLSRWKIDTTEEMKELVNLSRACSPLYDLETDELIKSGALGREYSYRFLIEGVKALPPHDRETLFTVLGGLLAKAERAGGGAQISALLKSWESTGDGTRVDERDLADLVRGTASFSLVDEHGVCMDKDEEHDYYPVPIDANSVEDAILKEYAGIERRY